MSTNKEIKKEKSEAEKQDERKRTKLEKELEEMIQRRKQIEERSNKHDKEREEMIERRKQMEEEREEIKGKRTKLDNEREEMIEVRKQMEEGREEMIEKRKQMENERNKKKEKRDKKKEKLKQMQRKLFIFDLGSESLLKLFKNEKDKEKQNTIGEMIFLVGDIQEQNEQIKEQNLQIEKQDQQIEKQDERIKEQNLQIEKQNELIKEQNNRIDKQFERFNMNSLTKKAKGLSIGKVPQSFQQEHKTQEKNNYNQQKHFAFIDREKEILTLAINMIHVERKKSHQYFSKFVKPALFFLSNMFGTGKTWFGKNFLNQLNKILETSITFRDLQINKLIKQIKSYPGAQMFVKFHNYYN
ncbi:hypothetical protein M0812_01527 [Anaeramoeba flamelloides]|uniref:Uncharacterized protein n=1 Tax=Anaeramoeba flamelloides TaxID=1746091 RepID=A0AAV8A5K7_9EUKA|nr:hypothetical protein M0812_01527 [Anaeramoeba flamelloides]